MLLFNKKVMSAITSFQRIKKLEDAFLWLKSVKVFVEKGAALTNWCLINQ